MKTVHGIIPYDEITGIAYVNAVGVNEIEAAVNLDLIESDEVILQRIKYLPATIQFDA